MYGRCRIMHFFIIIEMGSAAASCSIRHSTVMKNKTTKMHYLPWGRAQNCQKSAAPMIAGP